MFRNYCKTAFRSFWRNKRISLINLFGLSVGMTASVFVLLWVQNEWSHDNYHPGGENIYRITNAIGVNADETWLWENSPYPMGETAAREVPGIRQMARLMPNLWGAVIKVNNKDVFSEKNGTYADNNWFQVFHHEFIEGSPEAFAQDMFSMVLTEKAAKKYFGSTDIVGRTLQVDTNTYTVRAVMKDNPANSSFRYDMWMPIAGYVRSAGDNNFTKSWGNFNSITFLQLQPGVSTGSVTAGLNALVKKYRNPRGSGHTVSLQPLTGMYFETGLQSSNMPHGNKKAVYIFCVLGVMLLVVACINYVNLTTAKASLRAREVSVRKIIGAGRAGLFMQFIVESLVMSVIALALSLVLVQLLMPVFNNIAGKELSLSLGSVKLWIIAAVVLAAVTILNGLYPAFLLSSFRPLDVFRGRTLLRVNDAALRKGLVVFQFCLSMILITATLVVYKQMKYVQETNPGYSVSQTMAIRIPWKGAYNGRNAARKTMFAAFRQELLAKPGILATATGNSEIMNVTSSSSGSADWDGRDTSFNPTIAKLSADPAFRELFGLTVQRGRWFTEGEADYKNFILNETAARELHIPAPVIGQRLSFNGDTGKIVGIVKDFHYRSMHEKVGPMIITNNQGNDPYIFIKTQPGRIAEAIAGTRTVWNRFLSQEPFEYNFLDDSFNNLYKADLRGSQLIFVFSVIAIIISALGLFGLASFLAQQRTREIGIRKVLGASVKQIAVLLSKDFMLLVGIAIIIASPVAWWLMHKWLEDFAYRMNFSVWLLGFAGLLALVIALLSVSVQTLRAAVENPVKSLRSE